MDGIESEFVKEIQQRPTEMEPRFVYADWLDEQGRPLQATYLRDEWELCRDNVPAVFSDYSQQESSAKLQQLEQLT